MGVRVPLLKTIELDVAGSMQLRCDDADNLQDMYKAYIYSNISLTWSFQHAYWKWTVSTVFYMGRRE